jgi:signal transduction histidine kinase
VRNRILRTIVAIAALALVGFGVPLAIALANAYRTEIRLVLEREASAAAAEVPADPQSIDPDFPPPEPGTHLAIYNADGSRRTGEGPPQADAVVRRAYEGDPVDGILGDETVVAVPVLEDDRPVAVVRAAASDDDVDIRIAHARMAMATLAAAVLVIAVAAAWWQSRRLARPLVRLSATAGAVGRGDFTARAPRCGLPEVDAVAAALDAAAERLGRIIERERAFSADVSHQLRTPLAGLRIELENALHTPGVDRTAAIGQALGSIDRLSGTVEDLLMLARDSGSGRADITAALALVRSDWEGPLTESGRRLVLEAGLGLPPVAFADAALRHVLDVLVANSVEHGLGTVTVTAAATGGDVVIEVSDEGPGLAGDPGLAFTRRADRHHTHGIGLALARTLAEAEGGALIYRSPPPRFRLTLPRDAG